MYLSASEDISECISITVYVTTPRLGFRRTHRRPRTQQPEHARERITDDQSKERGRVDAISLPSTYAAYLDLYSLSHDSSVTVQPQVIRIYFPTEAYPDPGARFSAHA